MLNFRKILLLAALLLPVVPAYSQAGKQRYQLIAHRGGVTDSIRQENSLTALEEAANRGYYMIEVDLRMSSDSVLVTHHDDNLKRSFGIDRSLSALTWQELNQLKNRQGYRILSFEEVLQHAQGQLQIMIDLKIRGNHPVIFNQVIALLKKYRLYEHALMIGTDEATPFFTGKIKLSCTRKQLEENIKKPGYSPSHYYLFSGDITPEDAAWAKKHGILAVGVLNAWALKGTDSMHQAQLQAQRLIKAGLTCFQVDSIFEQFFQ